MTVTFATRTPGAETASGCAESDGHLRRAPEPGRGASLPPKLRPGLLPIEQQPSRRKVPGRRRDAQRGVARNLPQAGGGVFLDSFTRLTGQRGGWRPTAGRRVSRGGGHAR